MATHIMIGWREIGRFFDDQALDEVSCNIHPITSAFLKRSQTSDVLECLGYRD